MNEDDIFAEWSRYARRPQCVSLVAGPAVRLPHLLQEAQLSTETGLQEGLGIQDYKNVHWSVELSKATCPIRIDGPEVGEGFDNNNITDYFLNHCESLPRHAIITSCDKYTGCKNRWQQLCLRQMLLVGSSQHLPKVMLPALHSHSALKKSAYDTYQA